MPEATQFRRSPKRSRYPDCIIHQAENGSMRVYFTEITGLSRVALGSYLKLSDSDCSSPYTVAGVLPTEQSFRYQTRTYSTLIHDSWPHC